MLPLDCGAVFDLAHGEEFLRSLPPRPAVVLIEPRADLASARPLLLRTADLRRRLGRLLGPPDPASKRVNLREYAGGVRFRLTGSSFEQAFVHWQHARALWPGGYRQRLGLRPPALVKMNLATEYPRAYVTRRIAAGGFYFGPFATRRAADVFLGPFLDLFRIRRCQIKIRRDPAFPGCIYSEMKMCLAPCFAGCMADEYAAEVGRVVEFLGTGGVSLLQELARQREAASSELDFERAAALHRRMEKVDAVRLGIPELVRRLDALNAVVLERAAQADAVAVFAVRAGRIADPFLLQFTALASQPRSVEEILRGVLEPVASVSQAAGGKADPRRGPTELVGDGGTAAEREDHLALLARWFYGRPREGEIFYPETRPEGWPYRRILRACSRLLAPRDPPATP
jgi:excinuclease ABC subunit C